MYRTQKRIAKHSSFAIHNLFTLFNIIELPISQKFLFYTLVALILNFGSEIWSMHDATDIELIHTKFLRRILGVKKCTNLSAIYGELGRYLPIFGNSKNTHDKILDENYSSQRFISC